MLRTVLAFAVAASCTGVLSAATPAQDRKSEPSGKRTERARRKRSAVKAPPRPDRVETLEAENQSLKARVDQLQARVDERAGDSKALLALQESLKSQDDKIEALTSRAAVREAARPAVKVDGYVDTGFFVPDGNGVGFVNDVRNTQRARFPTVPWILLGDPWATAVNSRGEPADTDGSFAIPFDNVDSSGRSSFLLNELNVDLSSRLDDRAVVFASVDFLARTGSGGRLGDLVDLDFGYLELRPWTRHDVVFEVGKYRSVFGLEYRRQESPDRTGVTPSLIHRYVGGHPVGLKGRGRKVTPGHEWIAALAVNNGSSHVEEFSFAQEVDFNNGKHVSGRLSHGWTSLKGGGRLELGISHERGAQDRQRDDEIIEQQFGADAAFERDGLEVRAEYVDGISPGRGAEGAPRLTFQGGHLEASYAANNEITPYLRWEYRDAVHVAPAFAYVIDVSRWTAGCRVTLGARWTLKAEYLHNLEHGPVPRIDNDVFTTSQVMTF